MIMKKLKVTTAIVAVALSGTMALSDGYGPFPVTLKGYSGDKTNTVSYSGQIARHVLEQSLKKLAGKGNGGGNAADLEAQMLSYFNGSDDDLPIIAPKSKDGFKIKQTSLHQISKGKNISGKFYDGAMPAWPGNMSGKDVAYNMIAMAAKSNKGFDADTGYDWAQLISKYTMGAMAYNQAVDNYLDEKLSAEKKPNNKPYKDGDHYTGKEHSWDEAFGYWGAAAHQHGFNPNKVYEIAENIRTHKGGTAVVLGSLSPRTRNAQVEVYENKNVDYLVATDAIGMGLNLNINHVSFSSLEKFDGRYNRNLAPNELGQIAGRAGRYKQDGTFSHTKEAGNLDPLIIQQIENHNFDKIQKFYWRNSDLDFNSTETLLSSLKKYPIKNYFIQTAKPLHIFGLNLEIIILLA